MILLPVLPGAGFRDAGKTAIRLAVENKAEVRFRFNGITCTVTESTKIDLLCRDYDAAGAIGWNCIGPVYAEVYSNKLENIIKYASE